MSETNSSSMNWLKGIFYTLVVFGAFSLLQYQIYYPILVAGGLVAGIFMYKTSDNKALTWSFIVGSVLFGVFAYVMAIYFPIK